MVEGKEHSALQVRGVVIGEGQPKICVSLTEKTAGRLLEEAGAAAALGPDLIEWRVDHFEGCTSVEAALSVLAGIRSAIADLPLVFTFRSLREGGQREIAAGHYAALNRAAAASGLADLVDIELFSGGEETIGSLIGEIRSAGAKTIVSNHDFGGTPPAEEMMRRLELALRLGGDLPKIAVMPQAPRDVLKLLETTVLMRERYPGQPVITMSMAGLGAVTRIAGEVFGSAVTFAAAGVPSAPGQLPLPDVRRTLELLGAGL
ncbi:type I 3-dehydroquinate dehydratase [Paenibacillus spiritus]|uniref:3-dehydroquinate dehydratase n=1 Tax=Paenibacillus spiritus TaxID=2496557 RepID=A0A5J5G991_9BACL|nr:type I 3-dehydroquinate dehydratase [Paenibacillus spiritus]